MQTSIDITDALQSWLNDEGHNASATPLPDDFDSSLPFTLVRDSGGHRTWPVMDTHNVGIDVYAETMADAMDEARTIYAMLDELNDTLPTLGGVQVYSVRFGNLPQEYEDAERPDVGMATFLALITTRTINS